MDVATPPPYLLLPPTGEPGPVVVSSPHSGRVYPRPLLSTLRAGPRALRTLEDGPIDQLAARVPRVGAALIAARYPRVVVDLNRDPAELDPELLGLRAPPAGFRVSPRARLGLGVVPSRIGGEALWRRPLSFAEVQARLTEVWRPYHRQLRGLVEDRRRRFGAVLLLDCHSMPGTGAPERGTPALDVALGDRFGRSCTGPIVAEVERFLTGHGLTVARNQPYAGGYITERFGRPETGRLALQLELRRGLFMDEETHVPHAGLPAVADLLLELVRLLGGVVATHGAANEAGCPDLAWAS